jgi:class 3 adenylate cyclase
MRMNSQIDITGILDSVHVPALVIHRTGDTTIDFGGGIRLAEGIPNARLVKLPGVDHLPFVGDNSLRIVDEIEHFLTGSRSEARADRVLATILFTDIVDSTVLAASMGDQRWRSLLHAHDAAVRRELERFRGIKIKSTGDGFLATFDAPARAIRCALSITEGVRDLGLAVRAGLHTGEIHVANGDIEGLSVHIASRVANLAQGDEVVVSRTVKDLIAGSGITLEDYGTHSLKGVPDEWQLYRASN